MSDVFEPDVLLLYCGRALNNSDSLPEGARKGNGFKARFVMMPCSSKIETGNLVKLIEQGADAVVVVACPGTQCQFTVGSSRAEHRVRRAGAILEEVGMSGDRVGMLRRSGLSADEMLSIAEERAGVVRPLGRNPMKVAR
jgi:F420-non-reducing hydrogenase iron-sulfur subunit